MRAANHQTVLFDFFGVIANDQYDDWLAKRGLERKGIYGQLSRSADLGEISLSEFFIEVGRRANIEPGTVREEFVETTQIREELVDYIKELRNQGWRVGVLTNSCAEWFEKIIQERGLAPLFDHTIISSDVGLRKPDTKIFEIALQELSAKPGEVVYVDDRARNVEAAEAIGMRGILYQSLPDLKQRLGA